MELQEAPENFIFKLWPWFEANKIRLACGAGVVLVAVAVISFVSWNKRQNEINAGEAFTALMVSDSRKSTVQEQAAQYMQIATRHPGTAAGQRALLQSAGLLFEGRKYPEAKAEFQQFLDRYPGSSLAAQATLGLASSLDAQGQTEAAVSAYQRVINGYNDGVAASYAKYRLAQIDEQLGKKKEALSFYEEVARANAGSQLGSEAGLHAMELKPSVPSTAPASTPAAVPKAGH